MVAGSDDVAMCPCWPSNFLYNRDVLVLLISRWAEVYSLPCARDAPRRTERYSQGCVDAAGRQNFKFAVLSSKAWLALDLGLSKLLLDTVIISLSLPANVLQGSDL